MTPAEEENFPRGCRKVRLPQKRPRPKHENNLFSSHDNRKVKIKKSRKSEKQAVTEDLFHNTINIQGTLSYNKIQEGMVILGCIRHITNFSLEIELPGLTFGFVHITNISDIFTKRLSNIVDNETETQDILKNMFKIGHFVVVRVLSIENDETGTKLKCSLKPSDINYEKSHNSFKKGMLVWGCVQSVLDHGFEISLGIKNCRVFLPTKNVDDGIELSIGKPIWCVVHKSESTSSVTTLRVSSKMQHIKDVKIEEINNLHDVIPGMQIELVTEKITSNGIQGKFINNYFGYVDQTHLRFPLDQLDTYKEGKLIMGFVLYIEPSTKITHFTLRNLDPVPAPPHEIGEVLSAKVISKGFTGIYLSLSSKEKCFVTNRRLIHALPKKPDLNLSDAISSKFPMGSTHACRIIDYNHMSRMYICAVDQALVKEKLFRSKDVSIGELIKVTIDSVKADGLVVVSGHIRGFVPNMHISNAEYSENFKKKFKAGDKINARVLFTQGDNIIFTLKSGLVESDICLASLEQTKRGDQYPGVVVQIKSAGALVVFYNNVLGWLSRHRLDLGEDTDTKSDPGEYFYKGQVIKPWALGVKGDKVILTLKPPSDEVKLKIGKRIKGIVSKIHKDRIDIKSRKGMKLGVVPVNHLSSSLCLCPALLKTFKPGDVMQDLLCVNNENGPFILSRREALWHNRHRKNKIPDFKSLRRGHLLRCSYISSCDLGIYVLPLIMDFTDNILVEKVNVVNKGELLPKFEKDQSVLARILNVDHDAKKIRLTIKNDKVFDNSVETVVSYFSQHLGDIKYLRDFGSKHGWDICQYQPGERVKCTVEQLGDTGGCLVTLPNGVKGLVAPHLCPGNLKPGNSVEGVFLSQDFKENYVEICLRRDISQKINNVQDGNISISSLASCMVENILVKNDYVLGVLKQTGGNKQLVYIPLYLNNNDRKGCHTFYEKGKLKICICGKVGNYLIGISKRLFLTLDKQKQLTMHKKTKSSEASNDENVPETKTTHNGKSLEDDADVNEEVEEENIDDMGEEEENFDEENVDDEEEQSIDEEEENVEEETSVLEEGSIDETSGDETTFAESDTRNKKATKRKRDETNSVKNLTFGDDTVKDFDTNDSITGPLPVLPGISSFFTTPSDNGDGTSSDEEEEIETVKKKKKLTPAERAELSRQEEDRLCKIERELADPTKTPKNAEQFERLLLANPHSSELWTHYISFYIAATELDKAKSVAKRALESIDVTAVTEKYNIWLSLLNMENMFGSKESFDKTFEEAIKYNEPLEIYIRVIKMLSKSEKYSDMEEKIRKVRSKYKQVPTMWLEIATTYYSIKNFKEARNVKEAALKSIEDRKMQLNLIIQFAILEFKYGEEQQGAAIFETILSSDPRKSNIWIIYVDQLVKINRIEQARKVLERAICQRLPLKKMKTIFHKFRRFEEKFGTPEGLEAVKQKAAEYFANAVQT